MKIKVIDIQLLAVLFLAACNITPQNDTRPPAESEKVVVTDPTSAGAGNINGTINGCGFDKENKFNSIPISLPGDRELSQINAILKFSGLSTNFKVYSSPIQNAMATIIDGKRYILYDPTLLRFTDITSGSYWPSMSILAHEIGHHLAGHTLSGSGSSLSDELEADKYSGFVLYKLGASLEQATAAMQTLASETDSKTHPAKYKRLQAIAQGWNEANEQRFSSAVPPPPNDDLEIFNHCQTEFFIEELISTERINDYLLKKKLYDLQESYTEGIIIEARKIDPNETDQYYWVDMTDKENNIELTIELTKVTDGYFKKGERELFCLLQYYQSSTVALSNLKQIMVPGRKIRFLPYQDGRETPSIYYLKALPRNGTDVSSTPRAAGHSNINDLAAAEFMVVSQKAYFHNTPNQADRRNGYLVYGEQGTIVSQSGQFVYVDFVNPRGRRSKGWILLSDIQPNS